MPPKAAAPPAKFGGRFPCNLRCVLKSSQENPSPGYTPQRLPDRDAVRGRPRLRIPRGPDLAPQHPVVKEQDHLIFVHELAVFEPLLGAEFLDGGGTA